MQLNFGEYRCVVFKSYVKKIELMELFDYLVHG